MNEVKKISFRDLITAMLEVMQNDEAAKELITTNPILALVFPVMMHKVWVEATKEESNDGREIKGN